MSNLIAGTQHQVKIIAIEPEIKGPNGAKATAISDLGTGRLRLTLILQAQDALTRERIRAVANTRTSGPNPVQVKANNRQSTVTRRICKLALI